MWVLGSAGGFSPLCRAQRGNEQSEWTDHNISGGVEERQSLIHPYCTDGLVRRRGDRVVGNHGEWAMGFTEGMIRFPTGRGQVDGFAER